MSKRICTIAQARDWFGERGMDISANNIMVRGRWALVKEEWSIDENEVDCYDLANGSIHAEAWGEIKYTDSPFIPRNEEATEQAIAKLDKEYGEDLKPRGLCLVAVDGDTAAGGLGAENDVLPFGPEHNGLVKAFLKAQLAFDMEIYFHRHKDTRVAQRKKLVDALQKAEDALHAAKVFHHKYHRRTSWELAHISDLDDVKRYKPFVIRSKEEWQPYLP